MATELQLDQPADRPRSRDDDEGVLPPRRPVRLDDEMDITPMIDMTFLLLVFFLVASTPDLQTAVDLPPARYGTGVSQHTAVMLTIAGEGQGPVEVYLADGKVGSPLPPDHEQQESLIREAVEEGLRSGKSSVLIKAEKGVLHREVSRVAAAASSVEGTSLFVAVLEVE